MTDQDTSAPELVEEKPSEAALEPNNEASKNDADQVQDNPQDDDHEGDEDGSDEGKEARKKRSRSSRYRDKITALEERISILNQRLEKSAEPTERPKLDDYADYDDYEAARVEWGFKKATSEIRAADAKEELEAVQRERIETLASDHKMRESEAKKVIPDYDQVISNYKGQAPKDHVAAIILESDKSALLKYHFASNPRKLAEINSMSPLSAAREIGRLETSLSSPKSKTQTDAPAPSGALKGGTSPSKSTNEMSVSDLENAFRKKGLI